MTCLTLYVAQCRTLGYSDCVQIRCLPLNHASLRTELNETHGLPQDIGSELPRGPA
jgi:hypothetical protein